MDQSGRRLSCTLFSDKLEALPQIYKVGDIVRLHRIKTERFQGELKGVTSAGFSALTFDGRVGGPVIPRTGSKSYHFVEEDQRMLEMLRQWAASRCSPSEQNLSTVQPKQFFDLTCQLVAKAELVKSVLLKVWDGTKCSHPVWKVLEEEDILEGNAVLMYELQNLTVDVQVYDNHIEVAKSLKPGAYLRINNLHAKLHASTAKKQTSNENHLQFHLHGGTIYGRGIQVLPADSYDVQELKNSLITASKIRKAEKACVRGNKKQIQLESQMNCTVVALTVLYGFCIIPENICNIVTVYMSTGVPKQTADLLQLISQFLLFFKSGVTPVLLFCLCKPFSRAVVDCCCCCCEECVQKSSTVTSDDNDNEYTTELELSPFSTIRRETSVYTPVGTHC
ncbi:UNVERIFIED_CONTAM: hypothetical protein FKN15_037386 [Acipenser sinensis]